MTGVRGRVEDGTAVLGLFVAFGFVIAAFFPFFALYLRDRGLRVDEIGLVLAAMALARVLANPLWGHYADTRLGRLTALRLGAAGAAVAAIGLNLVHGAVPIAVVSSLVATFMVATGPNIDAISLEHLGDERMSDYGRIRAWESMSYAAACLAFGALLQTFGLWWAMPVYAVSSLLVLAWTATLPRDRPAPISDQGRLGAVGAVFREAPRFWGFLAALLLLWTGFNAAWNFISLKITSEGGGALLVGMGTALGGLVEVPVMRASSVLQRRWGLRRVYVLGCCIYATGFLLWGLISNPTIVSFLTVFEGTAFALLFTTGVVVIGRLLPSSLYSTGNSVAAMVGFGIGPMLGAGFGGFVYEHAGPVVLYSGASALALGGGVVAWFALSTPALSQPSAEAPGGEGAAAPPGGTEPPLPPPGPGPLV
jgi:PPP family 3-phenylpropionic acid transporter